MAVPPVVRSSSPNAASINSPDPSASKSQRHDVRNGQKNSISNGRDTPPAAGASSRSRSESSPHTPSVPTRDAESRPRRVTSDMISFTATPVAMANRASSCSSECQTPRPADRRPRRFLHRQHSQDSVVAGNRPFGEIKIESVGSDAQQRRGGHKYGYMYSRGVSVDSDLCARNRDRRSSRNSKNSRGRAWSRALSVSHEDGADATTVAAAVTATPSSVWTAFMQTVAAHADEPAVSGQEEKFRHRRFHSTAVSAVDVTYSWAQHAVRVRCVARALLQLGFCAGEGVVVSAQSSPLLHAVNLAVTSLGGVVAHIRSSWSTRELRDQILPTAKATVVVVDSLEDNFREALEELDDQPESLRPPIRAVVVLGGVEQLDRAIADLRASINVMGAQDLLAVNTLNSSSLEDEKSVVVAPSLDSAASHVMPGQCCLLSFDYNRNGQIRAAELSHDNVLFTAAALARSFGIMSEDRLVGYLPLDHVASQVLELYMPLVAGLSVVCAPTYKRPLVRVITEHKPTVFFATPATWARFSEQVYRAKGDVNAAVYRWAKTRATNNSQKLLFAKGKGAKGRSLGYMLAKALVLNNIKKKIGLEGCTACYSVLAPLDFELERLFKTVDTPIYQLFGTPETSGFAAINFPHAWEFGSSGRALAGTTIRCDERSQETVLRGRNVFLGYRYAPGSGCCSPQPENDFDDNNVINNVEVSTCDADGWLRLCQRCFLTPTGFLKISDPRDFLVLSTGDWVPLHPFEFAMQELMPELDRAVLVGDGRTFLSALFFLKTSGVSSRAAGANKLAGGLLLDEDALKVGLAIGSTATTVSEAIRCQHWAVHFDSVLEQLPSVCSISGFRVRKWILMSADFSVESGELDPDTGDVRRRAVDRKYQALLDSLYN